MILLNICRLDHSAGFLLLNFLEIILRYFEVL